MLEVITTELQRIHKDNESRQRQTVTLCVIAQCKHKSLGDTSQLVQKLLWVRIPQVLKWIVCHVSYGHWGHWTANGYSNLLEVKF